MKVHVIGRRKATNKELDISFKIGYRLAQKGRILLSGGAAGIDISSVYGYLAYPGKEVQILLPSIEVPKHILNLKGNVKIKHYSNERWKAQLAFARSFMLNNLCDSVVVVGSNLSGGTFRTAIDALEKGKPVWVWSESPAPGNKDIISRGGKPFTLEVIK